MKKRIALMLVLAAFLSGCGAEPVPTDSTEPSTSATEPSQEQMGYTLGCVMPNLYATDAQGETVELHDILEEKKLVVLNFWFADCPWCVKEFPAIEVAYQNHKTELEILALNPVDAQEDIDVFRQEHSLTFPMSGCSQQLTNQLGVRAYPTSVFIDREGKISLIHAGAITDNRVWNQLFDHYLREDYTHRAYASVEDIL